MPFQPKPERVAFRKDKNVQQWLASLHPNSKSAYEYNLFRMCNGLGLSATEFKNQAEKNPKELSKQVKALVMAKEREFNGRNASILLAATRSYLNFNEIALPLTGLKVKRGKSVPHPYMSWEDANRIITLVDSAYQPIFKFMLWGIDAERFVQINNDPATIKDVKKQLEDTGKDFIKILIAHRKSNPNKYYVLIPREVAAYLPVRTASNEPTKSKFNIWYAWRKAVKNAGLPAEDHAHGPHNLRSVWLTEATKRSLPAELREFQLGHDVDALNYQRIMQDEAWVLEQFRKAWQIKPAATKQETDKLAKENQDLRERLARLEGLWESVLEKKITNGT